MQKGEAAQVLSQHKIPYSAIDADGMLALLQKNEVDTCELRRLGFRISRTIGNQIVVVYKGMRFGLII
ncbi:hypothetical protein KKA00_08680 [bacterium]|nr:hypothetical protein [bacterium]MBU1652282.1 hypothetical protein [bacterium]